MINDTLKCGDYIPLYKINLAQQYLSLILMSWKNLFSAASDWITTPLGYHLFNPFITKGYALNN